MNKSQAKDHIETWIEEERAMWANVKYAQGSLNRKIATEEPMQNKEWDKLLSFVFNYVKRAELFGLDNPLGRQATGKAITTLLDFLEDACILYGPMPAAGLSSGNL